MLRTRYAFAAAFCEGRDVLEVACGPGMGLGYLAQRARRVIGADYTESFLQRARQHYMERIELLGLDAHALPFREGSFDVVVFFEAIYYLARPQAFLEECRRVLRPGGTLLVCTVNPEWPGFHPSPLSVRYFCAHELQDLLAAGHFETDLFGAFPALTPSRSHSALLRLRRLAARLGVIPRTMKGKELLKRLFYGHLVRLGEEITDDLAGLGSLAPLTEGADGGPYKVLYAVGRKNARPCAER